MGRPSNREQRRAEILRAFAQVLAEHGYAGATIAAVAAEAGVAPGLVHHHFDSKAELLECLLNELVRQFRARLADPDAGQDAGLGGYADAALKLDARSDLVAARCWVGLFAEAVRDPTLYKKMRRVIDGEIDSVVQRSGDVLDAKSAGAVVAFVVGSLVVGAFAPRRTAGFAAPALRRFLDQELQRAEV